LHFKSDWHRLNVKRRLAKQPPVTEEQFEALLADNGDSEVCGLCISVVMCCHPWPE
jgi:hypothetical protein